MIIVYIKNAEMRLVETNLIPSYLNDTNLVYLNFLIVEQAQQYFSNSFEFDYHSINTDYNSADYVLNNIPCFYFFMCIF